MQDPDAIEDGVDRSRELGIGGAVQDLVAEIGQQRLHQVDHRRAPRTVEQDHLRVRDPHPVVAQDVDVVGDQVAVLSRHRVIGEPRHALTDPALEAGHQ
jgi:hypothetical protein